MSTLHIPLTWNDCRTRAAKLSKTIQKEANSKRTIFVYGVPRGGVPAVLLVVNSDPIQYQVVSNPDQADFIIDDVVDSGATRKRYHQSHPYTPFYALVDKPEEMIADWVIFPWEEEVEARPEENVRRLLQFVGEDCLRDGLVDTPARFCRALKELTSGYEVDISSLFRTFEDGCDELILIKSIEFYSLCEHHLLPFVGEATVGYIPQGGRIVGLSKIARVVDAFSRRLQVQERLTRQVTESLNEHLSPLGSACTIRATHMCMACRGVRKQKPITVTSSLTGVFRTDAAARAEFLSLAGK